MHTRRFHLNHSYDHLVTTLPCGEIRRDSLPPSWPRHRTIGLDMLKRVGRFGLLTFPRRIAGNRLILSNYAKGMGNPVCPTAILSACLPRVGPSQQRVQCSFEDRGLRLGNRVSSPSCLDEARMPSPSALSCEVREDNPRTQSTTPAVAGLRAPPRRKRGKAICSQPD